MKQRGFSLIELVVTVAVLALVLFATAPSIGAWMDNTRIRNAAESLQIGLQTARSEAVGRNQSISFYLVSLANPGVMDNSCALSANSGSWVVSATSPDTKCASAPSTSVAPKIVLKRPVGEGGGKVKVSGLQADGTTSGTTVTFNGFGRVVNADPIARIDITGPIDGAAYRNLQVRITTAGAIRMCDPHVPADSNDPRKC
ncbi:GspH/FimT family pseudopilin [Variovorax sp. J22R24]|uniref:GspH/FimT family pseudopilin n=1 Tax=Variovorax gracilis TaxID=3053502 RepID=UPI002576E6D7|nr:GspH/FimT family pseudopilin [Variovorax sp. J22R24]MDM0106032.1 GspH/FimT family pseudopilin [Variovorax sp. J22R24]